tara:strand:- start:90 stop:656 length:567 start_codon:yes stop_codon:yes gene_type:complete
MTCKINADTSDGLKFVSDTSGIVEIQANGTKSNNISFTGRIVQTVNNTVTALATGTTVFPRDDTIHQSNEGIEFMTLAITPTHASNKLLITARVMLGFTVADSVKMISLFQDSTANALATTTNFHHNATQMDTLHLSHYMAAGTTSATTFKIRGGCDRAGTTSFNGQSGARKYGGVDLSSITITEIAV